MASTDDEIARLARENAQLRARIEQLEHSAAANADAAAFLRSLLAAAPAFILRTDSDLRLRYVNLYQPGITPDEVIGRPVLEFLLPEVRDQARTVLERTRDTGEPGFYETMGVGAHGEMAAYETYVSAVPEPDGKRGLCLFALETTMHKRREQALRESREQLRLALDATGLGLWSWDLERNEVVWDDAMKRLHGCEPPCTIEEYVSRCVHPHDRADAAARTQRLLTTGRLESWQYRVLTPNGDVRWVLTNGTVLRDDRGDVGKLMGGTLDITQHRALEEQLRQSQKLEAVGSLTAGIAHNFNNMLMVIMPTLELATRLVPAERAGLLREASHAAGRASELVRQLMTFAGQSWSDELGAHDVGTIVEAAVGICRRAFDRRISLHTIYDGPPATIECNAGQIEQVLVNLLLNARDAVFEAGPGRGHVTVRVRSLGYTLPPLEADGQPRPCVRIEVMDDGVGMADDIKGKAFEPFFTTKPVGRGTGLGLATSYAIVRDHKGAITCDSEPGQGSTFAVLLPLTRKAKPDQPQVAPDPLPQHLNVLIVDDDAAVRSAVAQVLEDAGVHVEQVGSGRAAVAHLARAQRHVDVVLLDRSMPDGLGESYVPNIRELAPRTRILFFTGQTIEPALGALVDGVVHKPVRGDELLEAIHRALETPESGVPGSGARMR